MPRGTESLAKSLTKSPELSPIIPLDSADARYNDYLEQVRKKIKEKWAFPCVRSALGSQCEVHDASLDVHFGLLKDGRVEFVEVVRKSEYPIYDEYAVNAITLAAPFPPVPRELMALAGAHARRISISAQFRYEVEQKR